MEHREQRHKLFHSIATFCQLIADKAGINSYFPEFFFLQLFSVCQRKLCHLCQIVHIIGNFWDILSVSESRMGNSQARQRIKARDFDYLAKYTGFVTCEVSPMRHLSNV